MRSVRSGHLFMQVYLRFILRPLFFLVYINNLVENVSSDAQLFADDTSAATQLNSDLEIISQWAYQWKMQFNPDKNKQAIQVIFSQKRDKSAHPLIYFNRSEVILKHEQKHFGRILDSELNFLQPCKRKDCQCEESNRCYKIYV